MTALEERWRRVLAGKEEAERLAGRPRGSVCLVAVSKFHPASDIAALRGLGQLDFGENYMQEARAKQQELAALGIRWHAIGALQSNKAKDAAGRFHLLHTLGSESLARALARRLPDGAAQDVLIEVNIGEEPQKAGVVPADLPAFLERLLQEDLISEKETGLRLRGLMCLPPRCGEGEQARPWFARLRGIRDEMAQRFGMKLPELSMGMSGDYRQAIEEGATIIRVGTEIFGPRPIKPQQ
ncbi:MAG: YggS family pyridoxal phosphate-dependent enzyme [Mailhella sp.]|nr:YggS family pyridoxal phosphate-dependent enzyme [Mailhella sp.]